MSRRALGIDLGTTSAKVVVLDEGGRVHGRGSARHATAVSPRPGEVEIAPERWRESVLTALASIEPAQLARVDVVGITGNMSSVVLVDETGAADGPAILLADDRGADEIADLPAELAARIQRVSGNAPATVFSLSTLLWLARRHPERLEARVFCTAKDWLRMQLCDSGPVSEVTDAANSLLVDRDTREWDLELAAHLGIPATVLPPLRGSSEVVGRVSGRAAELTGLPVGTPVVTGSGDMASLALGGGFETEQVTPDARRKALVSLGTSITVLLPAQPDAADSPLRAAGTTWHPLFDAGSAFELCSLVTGGLALNWLAALTHTQLAELPVHALAVDDPLVMVPHLAGSAFPEMRPDVRGAALGLSPTTGALDLASAVFEGLAFELDQVLRAADVDEAVLTGGGVRVPGLVAAIAETLPVPTTVADDAEASARGAALLGLRGIGSTGSAGAAPEGTSIGIDPTRVARRAARRARYFAARALIFNQNNDNNECDGPTR